MFKSKIANSGVQKPTNQNLTLEISMSIFLFVNFNVLTKFWDSRHVQLAKYTILD